jgi:hypothetical protein
MRDRPSNSDANACRRHVYRNVAQPNRRHVQFHNPGDRRHVDPRYADGNTDSHVVGCGFYLDRCRQRFDYSACRTKRQLYIFGRAARKRDIQLHREFWVHRLAGVDPVQLQPDVDCSGISNDDGDADNFDCGSEFRHAIATAQRNVNVNVSPYFHSRPLRRPSNSWISSQVSHLAVSHTWMGCRVRNCRHRKKEKRAAGLRLTHNRFP